MADGGNVVEKVVYGLGRIKGNVRPGDYSRVVAATESLKDLLPRAYVDGLKAEILEMLGLGRSADVTSVYLSFYGGADRAEYLKIGIAKSVRARMSGIATGNPVPRLWTYEAKFGARQDATAVESALLQHMSPEKIHGEWVYVRGLSEQAAHAVVQSLAEVASEAHGYSVAFVPAEV